MHTYTHTHTHTHIYNVHTYTQNEGWREQFASLPRDSSLLSGLWVQPPAFVLEGGGGEGGLFVLYGS